MPQYAVTVERTVYHTFTITASSQDTAETTALARAAFAPFPGSPANRVLRVAVKEEEESSADTNE